MQSLRHSPAHDTTATSEPLRRALARLNADLADYLDTPLQDMAQVWDAVLREIDETVLPRRFALANDAGVLAHLSITSRRLIGVQLPGHDTVSDTAPPSTQFAKLIARACAAGGPFHLNLSDRDGAISEAGQSCTVEDLRSAISNLPTENQLHGFSGQIEPMALAWLFFADAKTDPHHGGDATHFTLLAELAAKTRRDAAGRAGPAAKIAAKPSCTVLPLDDTQCIAIATDGNTLFLAVLSREHGATAADHWTALYT